MSREAARPDTRPARAVVVAAVVAAALAVAGHVVGKAVRDTLYLTTFPVHLLPWFFLGTGLLSAALVSAITRLTTRFSPTAVLVALAATAAVTMPLLWWAVGARSPEMVALVYAWTTLSGTFIVSGLWAVLAERFDPRAARRVFGVVVVATTVGGVLGAAGAHALLQVASADALLLQLAVIDVAMAVAVLALERSAPPLDVAPSSAPASAAGSRRGGLAGGLAEVARSPYLRDVAVLVILVTIAGTLADYALKDVASRELAGEEAFARFFSTFHGSVGAVTLLVQIGLARPLVARRGIPVALGALPAWLAVAAAALVVSPALWAAALVRGGDAAVRNSFHRAGYELLFVPLEARVKRLVKPILDGLLERVGDALGAGVVLLLVAGVGWPAGRLAWLIVALGVLGLVVAGRVRGGYVAALTSSLESRGLALDELARAADVDATARSALRSTLAEGQKDELRRSLARTTPGMSLLKSLDFGYAPTAIAPPSGSAGEPAAPSTQREAAVALLLDLSSADAAVARAALTRWDARDRRAVSLIIRLLAREELQHEAVAALSRAGDRIAGALADHLADVEVDFAIRRRLPRVLGACRGDVAFAALVVALGDRRFEVRYQAAAALERIQGSDGSRRPPPDALWSRISAELEKSRPMWEAQRLLDDPAQELFGAPDVALAVQRRGAHSLQHVFRLLGLVLEPRPLALSYRAVSSDDPSFRAVGLEYLESVLPEDVRRALWPLIGDDDEPPVSVRRRGVDEIIRELASSSLAPPPASQQPAGPA